MHEMTLFRCCLRWYLGYLSSIQPSFDMWHVLLLRTQFTLKTRCSPFRNKLRYNQEFPVMAAEPYIIPRRPGVYISRFKESCIISCLIKVTACNLSYVSFSEKSNSAGLWREFSMGDSCLRAPAGCQLVTALCDTPSQTQWPVITAEQSGSAIGDTIRVNVPMGTPRPVID